MLNHIKAKELSNRLTKSFSEIGKNLIVTLHKDLLKVKMTENESLKITNAAHKRLDKSFKKIEEIIADLFERMISTQTFVEDEDKHLENLDQNELIQYSSFLSKLAEVEHSNKVFEELIRESQASVSTLKSFNKKILECNREDIFQELYKDLQDLDTCL